MPVNRIREYESRDRPKVLELVIQFFNHHADCVSIRRWVNLEQAEIILDEWLENRLVFVCESGLPAEPSRLCEPADPFECGLVSTEVSSSTVPHTEGMILGLVRLREDHGTYWIEDIIVDENCRGQGIGSEILKWAEDWVRARGATSLFLDVVPANRDALDFFISMGYVYLNTIELRKDFEETVVPDGMQADNRVTGKEGTATFTQVTFQGRHLLVRGLPEGLDI
jgi:GNAT superfamily N-acetyltransferase